MLICHCHRIDDQTIRDAVEAGARSVEDVGQSCGAGSSCGGCVPAIADVVVAERRKMGGSLPLLVFAPEPDV